MGLARMHLDLCLFFLFSFFPLMFQYTTHIFTIHRTTHGVMPFFAFYLIGAVFSFLFFSIGGLPKFWGNINPLSIYWLVFVFGGVLYLFRSFLPPFIFARHLIWVVFSCI